MATTYFGAFEAEYKELVARVEAARQEAKENEEPPAPLPTLPPADEAWHRAIEVARILPAVAVQLHAYLLVDDLRTFDAYRALKLLPPMALAAAGLKDVGSLEAVLSRFERDELNDAGRLVAQCYYLARKAVENLI